MQSGGEADLNETHEKPKNKRERDKSGSHRYFVNIGSIDGLTKADLIHFLSDVSGIKRRHFGELTMQKNCSFINVDNDHDKGLSKSFKGTEIEGRSIRVNRDDEGNKRSRPSSPRQRFKSKRKKSNQDFPRSKKRRK